MKRESDYPNPSQVMEDWMYSQLPYRPKNYNIDRVPAYTEPVWKMLERFPDYIIHEDEELLIVNKPPGVCTHHGHNNPVGVLEIANYYYGDGMISLPHRLDKDTSGILVLTKTDEADRIYGFTIFQ